LPLNHGFKAVGLNVFAIMFE